MRKVYLTKSKQKKGNEMFKKLGKKAKALGVVAGATIISTSAQAAVTYDTATKKFER